MTHRRYKEAKLPMLIGLLGEGLNLAFWIIFLITNTFNIAFGDLDSETAAFSTLAGGLAFFVTLVFLVFFISHIKHYRTLIVEEAAWRTASKAFRSHLVYGVVIFLLFFPSFAEGMLTSPSNLRAIAIGIPYIVSGILGFSAVKKNE